MQMIRLRWGKFRFDVPGEVFILLAIRAVTLLLNHVS